MAVEIVVVERDPALDVGDALGALGLDTEEAMIGALGMTVERGQVLRRLSAPGLPLHDALIAWPDSHCGLVSLVENDPSTGRPTFRTGWPFDLTGVEHNFTPFRVLTDAAGNRAAVTGDIDDAELTVFDTVCAARALCWNGGPVRMRLRGWAVQMTLADMTPDRFKLSDLSPSVQEAFAHGADADGFITIHKEGAAMMFGAAESPTPLYRVRGPVKDVAPPRQLFGMDMWMVRMTITRTQGGDADLDVAVNLTSAVWNGPPPRPGQDVEALIWLQATFDGWEPD